MSFLQFWHKEVMVTLEERKKKIAIRLILPTLKRDCLFRRFSLVFLIWSKWSSSGVTWGKQKRYLSYWQLHKNSSVFKSSITSALYPCSTFKTQPWLSQMRCLWFVFLLPGRPGRGALRAAQFGQESVSAHWAQNQGSFGSDALPQHALPQRAAF